MDVNKLIEKFKQEHAAREERIEQYFPKSDDLLAIVLRGHLLIEEGLDRLNSHCFHFPNYYHEAKLSFHKKILIAQAQLIAPNAAIFFPALFKLNELRNNLVHNLDSPQLTKKITAFVGFVENTYSEELVNHHATQELSIEKRTQSAIFYLLGQMQMLDMLVEFMEKSRSYGNSQDKEEQ